VDWKLELIVVPVTDIDRAKAFYVENAGFDVHVDVNVGDRFRVVQLVPRGSECAIALMEQPERAGSAKGLHLIVRDIDAARAELLERDVEVSEPYHFEEGRQLDGADPERRSYNSFLSFSDPDGNGWLVQEVKR
jgi:catechol 2,3-dioxygenase-like lactoylglutathione lyase family enzyme